MPSQPLIWTKSKRTTTFFVKPFHKRDILLFLYWLIVKRTVFFLFVCQDWQGGLVTGIFVFACLLVYEVPTCVSDQYSVTKSRSLTTFTVVINVIIRN